MSVSIGLSQGKDTREVGFRACSQKRLECGHQGDRSSRRRARAAGQAPSKRYHLWLRFQLRSRARSAVARLRHGRQMSFGGRPFRPAVKNTGKMGKSSAPVLSAAKPWFPQGFSHFWSIAWEFCSAHATRCMAPAALYFASRTPNRVVFRVARVVKTLGFCMSQFGNDPRRWRR